jgi:hypothetical protein
MDYEDAVDAVKRIESGKVERPGPGKYEGNEDRVLAEILDGLALDGCDEDYGSVSEGQWVGRIGRFVVYEDDRGFFSYSVFEDEPRAMIAYAAGERAYYAQEASA